MGKGEEDEEEDMVSFFKKSERGEKKK
jgi:hypothetical protein